MPKSKHSPAEPAAPSPESQHEVAEYKEKWQRALAELENTRKRFEQEKSTFQRFALGGLLTDLLPVIDNFYRALEHVPEAEKTSAWVTGIQYIQKNLLDVLEQYGVKEMAIQPGERFDASLHEAIGAEPSDTIAEDHLIAVKTRGYLLGERVLRPAQVIVSSGAN